MTIEQKELYLSIKNDVESGDYQSALDTCDQYAVDYPQDVNGWLYYILAYNNASSLKQLAQDGVDLHDCVVFQNALSSVDGAGKQRLLGIAESINKLRKKTSGSQEHANCMQYFAQSINSVKARLDSLSCDAESAILADKNLLKQIRKPSTATYGNNPFALLFLIAMIAFPMGVISVILHLSGVAGIVPIIPLIVGALIVIGISVVRYKKFRGYAITKAHIKETCDLAEQSFASLYQEISDLTAKRKKMVKIYKTLKSRPKLNSASIDKLRDRFDKVYIEEDKALDI